MQKLSYKVLFKLIALIPLKISYFFSHIIGCYLFYLNAKSANITKINLTKAFPYKNKDEIKALTKNSLIESVKVFFENSKVWFSHSFFDKNISIEVDGLNLIKDSLTLEKGLILFTPHLGNIEILIKYLTQEFKCSIPYTKVKNNALENLIYSARKDMGANMVEANLSGVKSLLKSIKNKEVVAIASDQVPDVNGGYVAKFFNSDSLTMTLVTNLVIKTNSPCHSMICIRGSKASHFKISFSKIIQGLNKNLPLGANSMNRELEKCIMLAPEQYAWEYKKYKHASNENPYLY